MIDGIIITCVLLVSNSIPHVISTVNRTHLVTKKYGTGGWMLWFRELKHPACCWFVDLVWIKRSKLQNSRIKCARVLLSFYETQLPAMTNGRSSYTEYFFAWRVCSPCVYTVDRRDALMLKNNNHICVFEILSNFLFIFTAAAREWLGAIDNPNL